MEPLFLNPSGKDYIWGGVRLKEEFNKHIDMEPLAETWECSVHPDGPCVVENGVHKGMNLADVLAHHPDYLGERAEKGEELPILIKFIDAADKLSVQVHPDDDYAKIHEKQKGKTEVWYVMDAKPGAHIVYGFAHDVTKEQIKKAVEKGDLDKYLKKIPAHKDDVFFIPSGIVHAVGKGMLIAEIQESSNVTYRFYDYDRKDRYGKKRELHIDKALEITNFKGINWVRQPQRIIHYYNGCARELLCRCRYFEVERIIVSSHFDFGILKRSFQVTLCLEGEGVLSVDDKKYVIKKGQCIFYPAGDYRCHIDGKLIMLKVRI